jgi:hypothetical protein
MGCYNVPKSGYILVANPCEHVKEPIDSIKGREMPTDLRVAGVTVAKEAFVVRWDGVRRYVERLVQELEVGHVMADTNRIAFAICSRLPPVRHSTHYNAITVSVSRLLTQTVHCSTKGLLIACKTLE